MGSLRSNQMTWLRSADFSMVLALETARICLLVLSFAAAGWAVGFGMGYRRGVNAGITGDIFKPEHRVSAE